MILTMFSNKPVKTIELQFDGIYKYFDSNDELHLVMYVRPDSDKKHFIFKKTDGKELRLAASIIPELKRI